MGTKTYIKAASTPHHQGRDFHPHTPSFSSNPPSKLFVFPDMKLLGSTTHTLVAKTGICVARVEGYQDDRFRLMFVLKDSGGKDILWRTMAFRKGTKSLNLETDAWPEIERCFLKAMASQ